MLEAGKKAAQTRKTPGFTIEEHLQNLSPDLLELFDDIRDFIVSLENSIEENPKKYHITYRTSQNFICLQTYKKKLTLFLKLNPTEYQPLPPGTRDVSIIGHFGTGDFELPLKSTKDFEESKWMEAEAYRVIGG